MSIKESSMACDINMCAFSRNKIMSKCYLYIHPNFQAVSDKTFCLQSLGAARRRGPGLRCVQPQFGPSYTYSPASWECLEFDFPEIDKWINNTSLSPPSIAQSFRGSGKAFNEHHDPPYYTTSFKTIKWPEIIWPVILQKPKISESVL